MESSTEQILRETLQFLNKIRNLMVEGYAKSKEKIEAINKAKENSKLFEDDLFKRKAEKQSRVTVYIKAYGDGFSSPSEVCDLDPWINIYREYLQKFKIKHRLEKGRLWVQSNIEGEDEHLMIGDKKDKSGKKIHLISDRGTGEIRIEPNRKDPHDLIEKVETILHLKDGNKIKSTRTTLEFFEGKIDPKTDTNVPILDIETSIGGSGGSNGHFVHFHIINVSDKIAIDVKWGLRAFNYEWRSSDNSFVLRPGDRKKVEYRKDGEKPHSEEVKELNIFIEYKNNAGSSFFTRRNLHQKMTRGSVIYEFTVGDFHPVEKSVDYGIKGISIPIQNGDRFESDFEIEHNADRKIVTIGISRTLLSTWGFPSPEEIRSVITELGVRKVRKMIIKDNFENYCFTTLDFPQDFQSSFDGYKKLRDSI